MIFWLARDAWRPNAYLWNAFALAACANVLCGTPFSTAQYIPLSGWAADPDRPQQPSIKTYPNARIAHAFASTEAGCVAFCQ